MESVTLGSITQDKGDIYEVDKVVKHEDFDDSDQPVMGDIAILTLKTKVIFKSSVYPICLPKYKETFYGQEAIVAGEKSFGWVRKK